MPWFQMSGEKPTSDIKKIKTREQVISYIGKFIQGNPIIREKFVRRLEHISNLFEKSQFFKNHEVRWRENWRCVSTYGLQLLHTNNTDSDTDNDIVQEMPLPWCHGIEMLKRTFLHTNSNKFTTHVLFVCRSLAAHYYWCMTSRTRQGFGWLISLRPCALRVASCHTERLGLLETMKMATWRG